MLSNTTQSNDEDTNNDSNITLKNLCPTRWSSRYEAVTTLRYRYNDVMKALAKLSLTSRKKDEREEAASLKQTIEKFSFVCLVVLQSKILERTNVISKLLQSQDMDLASAVQLLGSAIRDLTVFRESFENVKQTARSLSEKWGVSKAFENTRLRKVKAHFDELCQDERISDAESYFHVNVFNAFLDIVISQLTQRFAGLRSTVDHSKVLLPKTLCTATDDELFLQANRLVEIYRDDIATDFPMQLLSFRSCLKDRISQTVQLLIVENSCITASEFRGGLHCFHAFSHHPSDSGFCRAFFFKTETDKKKKAIST